MLDCLQKHGLILQEVPLTYHHSNHVGGIQAPCQQTDVAVYGPAGEPIPGPTYRLRQGSRVDILGQQFEVIDVLGHTAGHITYFSVACPSGPLLSYGGVPFSGNCGGLLEDTPEQVLVSLDTLAALPAQTRVCLAYEYTLANLQFAQTVEPFSEALARHVPYCEMLRTQGPSTLSGRLGLERQINPFLRSCKPSIRQSLSRLPSINLGDVHIFAALCKRRSSFQ